jgi:glutaredoxin 3
MVDLPDPAGVTVYTTRLCGYCIMAKRLLTSRGIPFAEVDVSGNSAARAWLLSKTRQFTVPQIFIRGAPIGGYRELVVLDRGGSLARMVGTPGASEAEDAT